MAKKQRIDPRKVRSTLTWEEDLADGSVLMRRTDLMNEVLLGHLPVDAVRRAGLFENLAQAQYEALIKSGSGDVNEALTAQLETMEPQQRDEVLQVLREFACIAIVSPRYVMVDDGDPDHVPVDTLHSMDLMKIWNARPPQDVVVDPDQPVAVPSTEAEAQRFPAPVEARRAVPQPAVSERHDLVPAFENVSVQTVELIDGRVVEFAGC